MGSQPPVQLSPLALSRQGNYRILYTIQDQALIVVVIRIGHRREVYR